MSDIIRLRRGLNIKLKGAAEKILFPAAFVNTYAVKPVDFPGLVPRVSVKVGDKVSAGSVVVTDKSNPDIKLTSPVSGIVKGIERGERRKLLEIVIESSGDDYIDFGKGKPESLSREDITQRLLDSGVWPAIRQRPYHIIARPGNTPKSIFISGFDTAPLAPDCDFVMHNSDLSLLNTGIKVLSKLTDGKVNLVLDGSNISGSVLKNTPGVDIHFVSGPHPAGNVGVHIHHIDPVNKGDSVWYVNLQDVSVIGKLFTDGIYKPDRIIALAGSEVLKTGYHRIRSGASLSGITKGNLKDGEIRLISGNVLTGTAVSRDGFLGFYDNMVTAIPEGKYHEFFGWLSPGIGKFSATTAFLSSLFPRKEYVLDTNLHGGERAFVLTGKYEKVLPMDIFPMQLFKAIMVDDVDMMEKLGIYEVAEEDFALCEYVCPSKTEIQTLIRRGIDLMIKEMS